MPGPMGTKIGDEEFSGESACLRRDYVPNGLTPGPMGLGRDAAGHYPWDIKEKQSVPAGGDLGPQKAGAALLSRFFVPGDKIVGNLFFGGAGMDGGYISDMVRAFAEKHVQLISVDPKKWSGGTLADAAIGVDVFRAGKSLIQVPLDKFPQSGTQFNLIGYSYGSLAAAQVAINYGAGGTVVNHLVPIGSPISGYFLQQVKTTPAIKNVIVVDLKAQGDPLYAGMSREKLLLSTPSLGKQMVEASGHFYYAPNTDEGKRRRRELAAYLYSKGLR